MKIVITNVYCYLNKGDAGIVIAMIEQLRKQFNNPEISLLTLYPEIDEGKYGENIEILEPLIKVSAQSSKYFRVLHNIIGFIRTDFQLLFHALTYTQKKLGEADLIISCGGGYMQSFNLKHFLNDFILQYVQLFCAMKLKKDYVIFAQTVGPFSKELRHIIEPIMNKAKIVLTREEVSYKYVNDNFPKANNKLTADVAFLLNKEYVDYPIDESRCNIGVTVREWYFPNCANRERLREKYISGVVDFIINRSKDNKIKFYIMPQCIGPKTDNDLLISKEIYGRIKNEEHVIVVDADITPGQLKFLYSKMNYFIGTRMHSNIFALDENVPCLAISYDYKTNGIMKLAGMQDYVIDIKDVTSELLNQRFDALLQDQDVKERLDRNVTRIKESAIENFKILHEL